jgi:hypothetical protein
MFPVPQRMFRNNGRSWHVWRPLAFIHILLAGVAFGQDKPVSIQTIERARQAAVPIVCGVAAADGSFQLSGTVGSAFFINSDGYFMTAAHVLDELENRAKKAPGCIPAIYLPDGGWAAPQPLHKLQWFAFANCLKNAPKDIAVCWPKENPFVHPLVKKEARFMTLATTSIHADGTAVAFTGFPLNLVRPVTSKGYVASYLPVEQYVMVDKTAWPGASGSPLYLADGTVIGILVRTGKDQGGGLTYARTVELITEFLSKNKIAFHQQKRK